MSGINIYCRAIWHALRNVNIYNTNSIYLFYNSHIMRPDERVHTISRLSLFLRLYIHICIYFQENIRRMVIICVGGLVSEVKEDDDDDDDYDEEEIKKE